MNSPHNIHENLRHEAHHGFGPRQFARQAFGRSAFAGTGFGDSPFASAPFGRPFQARKAPKKSEIRLMKRVGILASTLHGYRATATKAQRAAALVQLDSTIAELTRIFTTEDAANTDSASTD